MVISLQDISLDGNSLSTDDLVRLGKGYYKIKVSLNLYGLVNIITKLTSTESNNENIDRLILNKTDNIESKLKQYWGHSTTKILSSIHFIALQQRNYYKVFDIMLPSI